MAACCQPEKALAFAFSLPAFHCMLSAPLECCWAQEPSLLTCLSATRSGCARARTPSDWFDSSLHSLCDVLCPGMPDIEAVCPSKPPASTELVDSPLSLSLLGGGGEKLCCMLLVACERCAYFALPIFLIVSNKLTPTIYDRTRNRANSTKQALFPGFRVNTSIGEKFPLLHDFQR